MPDLRLLKVEGRTTPSASLTWVVTTWVGKEGGVKSVKSVWCALRKRWSSALCLLTLLSMDAATWNFDVVYPRPHPQFQFHTNIVYNLLPPSDNHFLYFYLFSIIVQFLFLNYYLYIKYLFYLIIIIIY